MGRWIQVGGKQRWDPTYDRPDDELAARSPVLGEMSDLRQPPAAGLWNPESTIQATGQAMGKAEFEKYKKDRGLVEVGRGETSERVKKKTVKDVAREAIEEANKFLKETGQYVAPGTPTTQETKDKRLQGVPIIRSLDDLPEVPVPPPPPVDNYRRRGEPWGYVGGKEAIRMTGIGAAIERLADRTDTDVPTKIAGVNA